MKELSKNEILKLVSENLTDNRHSGYKTFDEEVDEAIKPDHSQWPKRIPFPGEKTSRSGDKPPTWTRMFDEIEKGSTGHTEHIGWYRYDEATEQVTPIVFTCEWDELTQKFPDLVGKLEQQFGKVLLVKEDCPNAEPGRRKSPINAEPIPGKEEDEEGMTIDANPYNPIGKVSFTRKKIRTELYDILSKEFEQDKEFTDQMKKFNLPQIIISSNQHRNEFAETSNEVISFQTHNINLYSTQKDFVNTSMSAAAKPADQIPDQKNYRLPRLYNEIYRRWERERLTKTSGRGLTPVFKLNVQRIPNDENFEAIVSSDMNIVGRAIEVNEQEQVVRWEWQISYVVNYSKRKPNESQARRMIRDVEIRKSIVVDLAEPKLFDGKVEKDSRYSKITAGDTGDNHPLTDINIREGLIQVIEDFKKDVTDKRNISKSINRARQDIQDLGGAQSRLNVNLNENEVVKKVINKLK